MWKYPIKNKLSNLRKLINRLHVHLSGILCVFYYSLYQEPCWDGRHISTGSGEVNLIIQLASMGDVIDLEISSKGGLKMSSAR